MDILRWCQKGGNIHLKLLWKFYQDLTSGTMSKPKKNILKSNDFGVMQTVFFAFTCKFGLCLHVEKVVICINKTNWHPLALPQPTTITHYPCYHQHPSLTTHPQRPSSTATTHHGGWQQWVEVVGGNNGLFQWLVVVSGDNGVFQWLVVVGGISWWLQWVALVGGEKTSKFFLLLIS